MSLPACFPLSSGQEMPTVSAVSLTTNEFPGGGVVAVYVCVCADVLDGCLDMWGGNRCMEERERGKTEKEYSPQDALGTPRHLVSGLHNRKSCFHNAATAASARSAVPGCSVSSLLQSLTTERITDRGEGHTN